MSSLAFAKLENVKPLPLGHIFKHPGSSHLFRVIGLNNEVERFTGNRRERAETLKLWKTQKVSDSRFAALVEWPELH